MADFGLAELGLVAGLGFDGFLEKFAGERPIGFETGSVRIALPRVHARFFGG